MTSLTPRSILYTARGNESVRAFVEMVGQLTARSNEFVRDRVARVPAKREKDTHQLPFDVRNIGHATLVAATRGSIAAHLEFAYSSWAQFLSRIEIALCDEAQQLGTPGANCVLAHIRQALDVIIGDA